MKDKETETRMAPRFPQEAPVPAMLVQAALERGVDPGVMQQMLALQERWEATQARKAYTVAVAGFKADAPAVLDKDTSVRAGAAQYRHATLGAIVGRITEVLSRHGLSVAWFTEEGQGGNVRVGCRLTHVAGHSEETWLSAPPDKSGSKNAIQMIGSTVTYLQRYTLLALLGLATADQDDDGRGHQAAQPPRQQPAREPAPEVEAPSALVVERLKLLVQVARGRSGRDMAQVAETVDKALASHAQGRLSAKFAAVLYGKAKAALTKDGWTEPEAWGEQRAARKEARKAQQSLMEEPPPPEEEEYLEEPPEREREPGEDDD